MDPIISKGKKDYWYEKQLSHYSIIVYLDDGVSSPKWILNPSSNMDIPNNTSGYQLSPDGEVIHMVYIKRVSGVKIRPGFWQPSNIENSKPSLLFYKLDNVSLEISEVVYTTDYPDKNLHILNIEVLSDLGYDYVYLAPNNKLYLVNDEKLSNGEPDAMIPSGDP